MIQKGDIILVKNTKLISRIIRWFTKSVYSHAAIAIDDIHVYETNYNEKSHIKHIDWVKGTYDIYRVKPNVEFDPEQIVQFIKSHLNNNYDLGEIMKIVLHINTKDDDGKYICSMLVRDAFKAQGIDLTPGIEIPSPIDLSESKLLYKVNA